MEKLIRSRGKKALPVQQYPFIAQASQHSGDNAEQTNKQKKAERQKTRRGNSVVLKTRVSVHSIHYKCQTVVFLLFYNVFGKTTAGHSVFFLFVRL